MSASTSPWSGVAQYGVDCADHTLEIFLFGNELFSTGGGQRIEACTAVVLRGAPLRAHVTLEQQPLQGGVERAFADLEDVLRHFTQSLGDAVAVHRAAAE